MIEYWIYQTDRADFLALLSCRALTASRNNNFGEVIAKVEAIEPSIGLIFISPELADKIKKLIPDEYEKFVWKYDPDHDLHHDQGQYRDDDDARRDDDDARRDDDDARRDDDDARRDDDDARRDDDDARRDDDDARRDDDDARRDDDDARRDDDDARRDEHENKRVASVTLLIITIALAIVIPALIWGMGGCGNVEASKNLPATSPTQFLTQPSTHPPTQLSAKKPTQVSTQAPAELPTFKGVAATEKTTEKTTEKAKSQQTQRQQVRTPQQQVVVVEEYVVDETPQQSYIPELTPSPSLSPSPQPEEEINSSRDSTTDEGVTGGNEGYGASISGQVESPVPEKIFEEEHPLPPAITQDEIEDIPPVVLTPAS